LACSAGIGNSNIVNPKTKITKERNTFKNALHPALRQCAVGCSFSLNF